MKRIVRNIVTCLTIVLSTGMTFTGCFDWKEKEPAISVDPPEPLRIIIEEENELFGIIDFVKIFSFDDLYLNENEDNLLKFSLLKHYYTQNRVYEYSLYLPDIVSDEQLMKLSDVIDNGKVSNSAAKVAYLQYFRAYNEESNCIGYFEWGCINPDDEIGFITQLWYADSEVTYTSDDGKLILSLSKGWNVVYEGYDRDYKDLHDQGYRMKWRFTEL